MGSEALSHLISNDLDESGGVPDYYFFALSSFHSVFYINRHTRYFLLLFHKNKKNQTLIFCVNPYDSIDDIELTKCVYGKRIKRDIMHM